MTTRPPILALAAAIALAACGTDRDTSQTATAADDPSHTGPSAHPPLPGEVGEGQAIAERLCSGCHAVGPEGNSPQPPAPPFRTLGERWPVEYLAEALAEGIMVGHETIQMPEFRFEPDEIDALLAYLETLQPEPVPDG